MVSLGLIFMASLTSSVHCVAMCGGLAGLVAAHPRSPSSVVSVVPVRLLVYNLGRVFTYVFLGALAGAIGQHLHAGFPASHVQVLLSIAAGAFLLLVGLRLLGALPGVAINRLGDVVAPCLARLGREGGAASAFSFGLLNGFLPCALVYAVASQAAASGTVAGGMLTMLAFGLGTLPAMLGASRLIASLVSRPTLPRVSGALIVIVGVITLLRPLLIHRM